jgi:hypothetical protein
MECRAMADLEAHLYRQEQNELRWEYYEASTQYEHDLNEQIEKLIRDPEWLWEAIGVDGFYKFSPQNLYEKNQTQIMDWILNKDYANLGLFMAQQVEHYVYDTAVNNLPGPD